MPRVHGCHGTQKKRKLGLGHSHAFPVCITPKRASLVRITRKCASCGFKKAPVNAKNVLLKAYATLKKMYASDKIRLTGGRDA